MHALSKAPTQTFINQSCGRRGSITSQQTVELPIDRGGQFCFAIRGRKFRLSKNSVVALGLLPVSKAVQRPTKQTLAFGQPEKYEGRFSTAQARRDRRGRRS